MNVNQLLLLLLLMLGAQSTWSAATGTTTNTGSSMKTTTRKSKSKSTSSSSSSSASIPSSQLPVEARNAGIGDVGSEEEDEMIATSYVLPNQIFNDGKPYYAGKDPISGQLDFSAKKTAGIETAANEVYDPKEKIVLSNSSPNIHDFLNLPVKYSSSKFVYPLVSSSYANLKYQGNNKNYVTNKKPTSMEAPVTPAPTLSNIYYTIPTTKLMAVAPTQATSTSSPSTTASKSPTSTSTTTSTTTTTTSTTTTSKKPTTFNTSKLPPRPPLPTRYTTSTRKPIPITTEMPTTAAYSTTPATPTGTTRKKFMPTKKYFTTSASTTTGIPLTTMTPPNVSTSTPPASPVRFPDSNSSTTTTSTSVKPATTSSTSGTIAPSKPTPTSGSSSAAPTQPTTVNTTPSRFNATSSSHPVVFTEGPTAPPSFSPLPGAGGTTRLPNLDAGDVYQTLGQKHTELAANGPQPKPKPPMTLADLFNNLADEDAALASAGSAFDAQGNLMQPIVPSKPAPFAMQGQPSKYPQHQRPHTTRPTAPHEVISGSQENFSNEYVSYQVQQPNVMQYRPMPGAINNVVISPGQQSASFVLGSQQQVGVSIGGGSSGAVGSVSGGSIYGSVENEQHFGKKPNVQYGTVISENINGIQRPAPPTTTSAGATANGHQNGRPNIYQDEPPQPPSPYQQLPLLSSNKRQKPQKHSDLPPPPLPAHASLPTALPQQATTQGLINPQTLTTIPTVQPIDTQELLVSTNIRFPPNEDRSDELLSGPIASGPPLEPHVNGHAQPLSLQQIQNSNTVAFPQSNGDSGIGISTDTSDDIQIQQHDVLTMNQHKQKLNFPQTPNNGGPSQHMEPPPPGRYPSAELGNDGPKRHNGAYNEFSRKPLPGRINHERPLPNILPQFRPNAKVSSGHSSAANYNHEPGNIRVPSGQPGLKPRPAGAGPGVGMSPQFAHRRQPLRYPTNNNFVSSQSAEAASNRRVYRLPPYGGAGVYGRRPLGPPPPPLPSAQQLLRTSDGYTTIERHAFGGGGPLPQPAALSAPERLAAFEEEDLVINDPPQPVTASKDIQHVDEAKLEPVVTLQMLQSQKKAITVNDNVDEDADTGAGEIQVPDAGAASEVNSQNGLYVVYPMKNGKLSDVDSEEGKTATSTASHVEAPSANDYQNTPFTVIRDEPQEPILKEPVKHKQQQQLQSQSQPESMQQHKTNTKEKFPYAIEKPDPAYTDQPQTQARVPGVLIAPRIINGAVGAEALVAPIAIAYTPTEPNPYRRYSNVNLATPVINEIRHNVDTQTEQALKNNHNNNEYDIRGQYFEKDFMAPFYPSLSLDSDTGPTAINTKTKPNQPNGWNILPSSNSADASSGGGTNLRGDSNSITADKTQLYAKNNINRADMPTNEDDTIADFAAASPETTTSKAFELDHFQPELQGGFKPIYPPGYKIDDEEIDTAPTNQSELNDENPEKPVALASRMPLPAQQQQQPQNESQSVSNTNIGSTSSDTGSGNSGATLNTSSSTTTTTSTTTTSTPKPLTTTTTTNSRRNTEKTVNNNSSSTTTVAPKTTATPTQRKKSVLETSLEALLFGEEADADFIDETDDGESRQQKQTQTKTINGGARPLQMVPRMGPRSLKLNS